jgi:hypothetical protein
MAELHIGKGVDLPLSIVTSKAAILAMTGMGKTYLARVMAEEMLKQHVQVVVADYTGVWWGLQSSASGKREGFPVVVFGGDHADVPINEDAGKLIADVVVNERISAILDTSGFEDDAPKVRFMNAFARRLYFANKRPMHWFIDEADEWVPQNPKNDQLHLFSIIKRIWQRGRVKGIGGTLISQRSALVNKSLLSQSDMLIALRTVGPQDRDALAAWFNSWGTEEQIEKFDSTISNLPDHVAWFWSPKHKLFVQAKARTAETFDSGATPDIEREIEEPERRTKVDVDKLGKQIAKLAEEAKSDDPVVLKKQLAHFKEQFETAKNRYVLLEQRLAKREKKKPVEVAKPVKVPFISPKTLKAVRTSVRSLQKARADLANLVVDVQGSADNLQTHLKRADDLFALAAQYTKKAERVNVGTITSEQALGPIPIGRYEQQPSNETSSASKLTGSRAILVALAQHGPTKVGKLKILSGISSLHTYRKYLGAHRSSGLVRGGDVVELTDVGRSAVGQYDPLPTGASLLNYWKNELGGGHARILSALIDAGRVLSYDELGKRAGIASEHTLRKYLGTLRTSELVDYAEGGVRLSKDFEGV